MRHEPQRAGSRLETLGFTNVHDYMAGKVDWLAHNLPVDATAADTPTIGHRLRHDTVTATLDEPITDIRASRYDFALVLAADTTLLGRLRPSVLDTADPTCRAGVVMNPDPPRCGPTKPPPDP